jgi:hypothetical protein
MSTANRLLLAITVLALLVLHPSLPVADDGSGCDEGVALQTSLVTLNNSGVTGSAKVCISASGVHTRITAQNLTPGNPYTVWFVYFDNPQKCLNPGHCTPADTKTPFTDPEGVLGRYDSAIATGSRGIFSGHVGLIPSSGSEIHVPIFAHGSLSPDGHIRARQLLTPQDPSLGAPGLGTSSDGTKGSPVAVAVFTIP